MSAESFGGGWGNNVSNYDDEVWQRIMNEAREQMDGQSAQNEEVAEVSSQGDGVAQLERHQEDLEERLVAENEMRMRQSEEELAEFERRMGLSPEAYWQELRGRYAREGVDLGLMPDVREMRDLAEDFLWQKAGGGDQSERVGVAIRTELEKMAQSKADEIRKWQSEGRGLPITFESEWADAGQKDIKNILNVYYGDEGRFHGQESGGLTEDEKVAWQMANLTQRPGELNAMWVFQSNPWRFEGESMAEYYNRLKNYRRQDQVRTWQIEQDNGKKLKSEAGEDEGGAKRRAEREETLNELGENKKSKVYALGNDAFLSENPWNGQMKAFAVKEEELAREQWERNPEEVREAIREVDAEIRQQQREREEAATEEAVEGVTEGAFQEDYQDTDSDYETEQVEERSESRSDVVERVRKKGGFRRALGRLIGGMKSLLLLPDDMDEYDTENEDDAVEGETGAEVDMEDEYMEEPEVVEDTIGDDETEITEAEEESQEEAHQFEIDVTRLTPEMVAKMTVMQARAERALVGSDLSEERRAKIQRYYDAVNEALAEYDRLKQEQMSSVMEEQAEQFVEKEGEYNFNWLKERNLISGETGKRGLEELRKLKEETKESLIEAVMDEDENAIEVYQDRIRAVKRAIEWVQEARREAKVIPFRPRDVEADSGMGDVVATQ